MKRLREKGQKGGKEKWRECRERQKKDGEG